MQPSDATRELKRRGLRTSFDLSDRRFNGLNIEPYCARFVASIGKKRDEFFLAATSAQIDTSLLRYSLSGSRTEITRKVLNASVYRRFALHLAQRHLPGPPIALCHAAFRFTCRATWDPTFYHSAAQEDRGANYEIYLLDVALAPNQTTDSTFEPIGEVLAQLALAHLDGPTEVLAELGSDDIHWARSDLRIVIHLPPQPSPICIAAAYHARAVIADSFEHSHHESAEYFEIPADHEIVIKDGDPSFASAWEVFTTNRGDTGGPAKKRPEPNSTHHLLLAEDPSLRYRDGNVLSLTAMARHRATAIAPMPKDLKVHVDWIALDAHHRAYELELEELKTRPPGESLTWLFLVDAGTNVFTAVPCPTSELSSMFAREFLNASWAGKLGLLRHRPSHLCLPTSYTTQEQRADWDTWVTEEGVALTSPASGFAAPIYVAKLWCGDSAHYGKRQSECPTKSAPIDRLRSWAKAHVLQIHATAAFGEHSNEHFNYGRTNYSSMKSVAARLYCDAVGINNVDEFFKEWDRSCGWKPGPR